MKFKILFIKLTVGELLKQLFKKLNLTAVTGK
jgi:hypothetical protein